MTYHAAGLGKNTLKLPDGVKVVVLAGVKQNVVQSEISFVATIHREGEDVRVGGVTAITSVEPV